MAEEELWRAELSAKLDHIERSVSRLEKRIERDQERLHEEQEKLHDRVRVLEIANAVLKRDVLIVGTILGGAAGAIATGIISLVFR